MKNTCEPMLGYNVGDKLELIFKRKSGVLARQTTVSHFHIENDGNVWVCYKGLDSGQGSFDPAKVGMKPFGLQGVIVVKKAPAHIRAYQHPGPRPGDRAYDLMC